MQTAVRRLVSRQLAAAWASWREAIQLSRDKQGKAQRALSYLTHSTLRHAFDAWRSRQHSSLEKQNKIAKALTYFTKGNMHRAFDSWRFECGRAAEKRELMRKATNLLLQSGLAKVMPAFFYVQSTLHTVGGGDKHTKLWGFLKAEVYACCAEYILPVGLC